jgi:hypothetical protein
MKIRINYHTAFRGIFALLSVVFISTCTDFSKNKTTTCNPYNSLLLAYIIHTSFVDPGEFIYMYNNLPNSSKEICNMIKQQLIHPSKGRNP